MHVTPQDPEAVEHDSRIVVEMLQELRYSPEKQKKRCKKVKVSAGKSVIGADFSNEEEPKQ